MQDMNLSYPPEPMNDFLAASNRSPCKRLMELCYFSLCCQVFYLILISANLLCILWTILFIGEFPTEPWFEGMEIFISVMVVSEVVFRACLLGWRRFFRIWLNLFDVVVGCLSIGIIIEALNSSALLPDLEGLVGDSWLLLRTAVIYIRLIVLMKNRQGIEVVDVVMATAPLEDGEEKSSMESWRRSRMQSSQESQISQH